ncbi:MAG: FAD-dependent oxidoreductase [Glaciihabitans sp.]
MSEFLVVGGGIGGMVAARRLALSGRSVTLFEAGSSLGGTVAGHTVGGLQLDAGAESFALRGDTVSTLVAELGMADDIVSPNPQGAWLYPTTGRAVPLPKLSLLGIPGSPLAKDVIAVIGMRAAVRAYLETFLPGTYGTDTTSLGELVRKRMGDVVLDNLVAPIVRGVHSIDPHDLDVDRVAPGLRTATRRTGSLALGVMALREQSRAGSSVAGIRGGMHRVSAALAADLSRLGVDIRLNAPATAVDAAGVSAGGERFTGRVVVAAPRVIDRDSTPGHDAVLATMVLDAPALDAEPRGTGLLVATGAPDVQARALTHSTAKWHWLRDAAGGRHVLRLSYGAHLDGHHEIARRDAETLLGVPLPPASVLDFNVVRWRRPERQSYTPDGIARVGETASGTGLAAVVAHAEKEALSLLRDIQG